MLEKHTTCTLADEAPPDKDEKTPWKCRICAIPAALMNTNEAMPVIDKMNKSNDVMT